jgi:hypothetical protein
MTPSEVANALGLTSITTHKYQIFKTSAIKGTGLDEAMEWYVQLHHYPFSVSLPHYQRWGGNIVLNLPCRLSHTPLRWAIFKIFEETLKTIFQRSIQFKVISSLYAE